MLVIDDHIWIANTGDSRAVMSAQNGTQFKALTEDHKPSEEAERVRIIKAGGEVYQNNNNKSFDDNFIDMENAEVKSGKFD